MLQKIVASKRTNTSHQSWCGLPKSSFGRGKRLVNIGRFKIVATCDALVFLGCDDLSLQVSRWSQKQANFCKCLYWYYLLLTARAVIMRRWIRMKMPFGQGEFHFSAERRDQSALNGPSHGVPRWNPPLSTSLSIATIAVARRSCFSLWHVRHVGAYLPLRQNHPPPTATSQTWASYMPARRKGAKEGPDPNIHTLQLPIVDSASHTRIHD